MWVAPSSQRKRMRAAAIVCVLPVLMASACGLHAASAKRNSNKASTSKKPARHAQGTTQQERLPQARPIQTGAIEGVVHDALGKGVFGATVTLRNLAGGKTFQATTGADGV